MLISVIRAVILYTAIIGAIRLMGKRQISELQTSELVVTLLISDIAAIPMQDSGQPLVSGFLPIAILVMCELLISGLMMKSGRFRRIVCGRPVIVVNDGKVDQKQLRRLRMTVEDLFVQLREKSVVQLEEVAYAIVETNGTMSVIKKPDQDVPTANMLGLAVPDTGMETVVISDGEISDMALSLCGHTREWLQGVLEGEGKTTDSVFIMTANTKGGYRIIEKEEP